MEEYISLTHSYTSHYYIAYDKYFTMLHKSLKQKPSPTARIVFQHGLDGDAGTDGEDGDYVEEGFMPLGLMPHLMTSIIYIPPISIGIPR